jgi:hypothetical protein
VKELEATDAAYRCASELLAEAESRSTRLQQERDEAYERLKACVDDMREERRAGSEPIGEAERAARDLVRRLAGPEKA